MANIFRSAIVLSPNELPDLFYFFIVKLAPDYEGLETGIGHELLLKAVAKSCGKTPK
jgi:DNA ligase-1